MTHGDTQDARLLRRAAVHALRMCLPTCPTYVTTKRERNSPRGRIALMRAIADGEMDVTREFADEMSYCLGCLACQTRVRQGVNYAELFETARIGYRDQTGPERNRAPVFIVE